MAKACRCKYTLLRNLYIVFAFLVFLFEAFVMYPSVYTATVQTEKNNTLFETSKPMHVLMAKTISAKDVRDTIQDIESLKDSLKPDQFKLGWRLFCYNKETYDKLLSAEAGDKKWKQRHSTEIFLEPGAHKNKFWHRHLNPKSISETTDYVWIMDGDIRLRNMSWECFWNTVSRFQPAIFAPAIMASADLEREKHKGTYAGSTHPWTCHTQSPVPQPNDIQRMVAMDVAIVELQLPVFTRTAWQIVYSEFSNRVVGWGDFKTVWGPDQVWCNVIDHYLFNVNSTNRFRGRPRMPWPKAKRTCTIQKDLIHNIELKGNEQYFDDYNNQNYRHTCMLIHSTPAEHLDTMTIKLYDDNATEEFYEMGRKDRDEYYKGFKGFIGRVYKAHRHLYRAYLSDVPAEYNCQECKHEICANATESE